MSAITIDTLHLIGGDPAARTGAQTVLEGVDLRPPGIPPAAVLIVRRVTDPLPGQFAADAPRPNARWAHALRQHLDSAYREAARPARGETSQEAVAFTDRAEMLACFLRDLLRGQAGVCWWWRTFLRDSQTPAQIVQRELIAFPAALALLSTWGQALPMLERLAPAEAVAIVRALQNIYALPLSPGTMSAITHTVRSPISTLRRATLTTLPEPLRAALPDHAIIPLMTLAHRGDIPRALLLALALSLAAHPDRVRRGITVFHRDSNTTTAHTESAVTAPSITFVDALLAWLHDDFPGAALPAEQTTLMPETATLSEEVQSLSEVSIAPVGEAHSPNAAANDTAEPATETQYAAQSTVADAHSREASTSQSAPDPASTGEMNFGAGVATGLGGVMFLVNLITRLALHHDDIGAWRLLDLLARALLEHDGVQLDADGLWRVLARLDGRDADESPQSGLTHGARVWLDDTLPQAIATLGDWLRPYDADSLLSDLLRREAYLYVTRTHVDCVLHLKSVTLAVRATGLDADPGWRPAFARIIAFHYR